MLVVKSEGREEGVRRFVERERGHSGNPSPMSPSPPQLTPPTLCWLHYTGLCWMHGSCSTLVGDEEEGSVTAVEGGHLLLALPLASSAAATDHSHHLLRACSPHS